MNQTASAVSKDPLLLSVKRAAEELGLSSWQVKQLVDAGTLPSTRVGRRIFIPTASVSDYVENVRATA